MKKLLSLLLAVLMAFSVVTFTASAEEVTETPAECVHEWDKWIISQDGTCTEQGIKYRECTLCGKIETGFIGAEGHVYGEPVTVEATCSSEGYTAKTCTRCGDVQKENVVPALPHTYGEWSEKLAPTCTETGSKERSCSVCNSIETEVVPALGHDYKATVVAPTYEADGYTLHQCSRCDVNYKDTPTEKLKGRVESIELGDKITMTYGSSQELDISNLIVGGDVNYSVTYKSSAENVAVIDEKGVITAKGMGNAKITATVTDEYGNVVEDTVDIQVNFSLLDWFKVIGSILMAAIEIVLGGLDFSALGQLFK